MSCYLDLRVGTVVSHKTISYLKNGKIYSFTKYNGVLVDWSDKSGVMFRKHSIDSLVILKVENASNKVLNTHFSTLKSLR